jgi:hypothetical protein
VGEALLYEAILTVAQLTSLHSLLPIALQHIRQHSLHSLHFLPYPTNVLDPKPGLETKIYFHTQLMFWIQSKIYFHTQLMFWIQNLVFERPKLEKWAAQKSIIDFHQEAFFPRHSSSNMLFLIFSCCLIFTGDPDQVTKLNSYRSNHLILNQIQRFS